MGGSSASSLSLRVFSFEILPWAKAAHSPTLEDSVPTHLAAEVSPQDPSVPSSTRVSSRNGSVLWPADTTLTFLWECLSPPVWCPDFLASKVRTESKWEWRWQPLLPARVELRGHLELSIRTFLLVSFFCKMHLTREEGSRQPWGPPRGIRVGQGGAEKQDLV